MAVYQEETGDQTSYVLRGAMRTMREIVYLWSSLTLQTEHQANERAKLDDLYRAMEIYVRPFDD